MIPPWPDFEAKGSSACSVPLRNTPGAGREGALLHDTPKFPRAVLKPHIGPDLCSPSGAPKSSPTASTCTAEATTSGSPGLKVLAGEARFGQGGEAGSGCGDSWP